MNNTETAENEPAANEPTVCYLVYEKAAGGGKSDDTTAGVGLTFAHFPDGKVKVATVKPGSAAHKSNKFARGQPLAYLPPSTTTVEDLNAKLKETCTVAVTIDGASKSDVDHPKPYNIDPNDVYGIDEGEKSRLKLQELEKKVRGPATIAITVGPKPVRWTKFTDHQAVENFKTIVGEYKGIDQFLEGIQGQIGLPFGNIERGMELEVKSDTQHFGASNNVGKFRAEDEYNFVANDHLERGFNVPGYRDREQSTEQGEESAENQEKLRHFVPLKVFLYATCAKPLQVSRTRTGTDTRGYSDEIPKDLKEFVLAVLLRRAREAVLTGDALKNAADTRPELQGLAEVARDKKHGRAVLQKLRDVIFDAFRVPEIDPTWGLPAFTAVAKGVVNMWDAMWNGVVDPPPEKTSDATEKHESKASDGAEGSKGVAGVAALATALEEKQEEQRLALAAKIDDKCLEALALLAREKLKEAGLTREEVIGLRLYTGPLFVKMNGALRGGKNKRYTNTIFAATSGLVKLSKVSPIPENRTVYRGLSGVELPKEFWDTDTAGVTGGAEMAFLSTTTSMEVAIDYSNPGRDNMPFIFEIKVGAIDKGAALSFLSQFPEEDEILMPPRSFLEVVGVPKKIEIPKDIQVKKTDVQAVSVDHVWAIPVSINCNVQNFNIENFAKARQSLLLSTVDQAIMEVREELAQMSSDPKYLSERAERPDDLAFASATQVQIYAAEDHPEAASSPAPLAAADGHVATASGSPKGRASDDVRHEECDSLPRFLRATFESYCPDKASQSDSAGSAAQSEGGTVVWQSSHASLSGSAATLPRLVVLVVTEALAKRKHLVAQCHDMKKKGVMVIAVLAPRYRKPDADAWWPPSMSFLHDCKCVDLRDPDTWQEKCRDEVVPLVRKRALLSRGRPQEYLLDLIKEEVDRTRHTFASEDPAWFNDDFNFRLSMQEALNLHSTAMSKLNLYLEEPSRGLRWTVDLPQRTCQRLLVGRQRRMLAEFEQKRFERESTETAIALCKMTHAAKGHDGVEEMTGRGNKTQRVFPWSPLMLHAADGNPELVRLLLAGKAQVNRQEEEKGFTALRLAAEYGCQSVVQVLLAHRASPFIVDRSGSTAFLRASENGHVEVLKLLYQHEPAVLDRANDINYTPLMAAAKQHHVETVRWLLANKADVNALTTDSGHSALIIAAESRQAGNEMVEVLLEHHADTKPANAKGVTALMSAIVNRNVKRVQLLLDAGADPDIETTVEVQRERQRQLRAADMREGRQPNCQNSEGQTSHEGLKTESQSAFREQEKQQSSCPADEWQPPDEILKVKALWAMTQPQAGADEDKELAEITVALRNAMPHKPQTSAAEDDTRVGLARWKTSDVKKLLQDPELGSSFAAAIGVVDKFRISGEDLEELLQIQGREHNPLYLPISEGGLGLAEIQVMKLKRELRRRKLWGFSTAGELNAGVECRDGGRRVGSEEGKGGE